MFLLWIFWIALFTFLIVFIINLNAPKTPVLSPNGGDNLSDLLGLIFGIVFLSLIAFIGVIGIINEFKNLFMYNALIKKGKKCAGKVKRAVSHEDRSYKSGVTYSRYHLEYQITDTSYVPSPIFYSEFLSYDPSASVGDKCTIYILEGKKTLNYLVISK